jgi:uroporphyrinogen III methyltransferase/synthase
VPVYQTVLARSDPAEVRRRLSAGEVDLVTFTSSSTVRNFIRLLGSDAVELLARTQIGCIGPITADTARELGLKVHLCPERYTIEALTEAIMRNFCNAKSEAPSHLPAL